MSGAAAAVRAGEFSPRRAARVVARNFRVWRRLAAPSLVGNMVDPLIYIFALGLGLGALVGDVDGKSYLLFVAPGIMCVNLLNVASFESMYSAFTRMHMQKTWDAMLNAPMTADDIVLGEWAWSASKALINCACIAAVLALFGLVSVPLVLAAFPLFALFALTCAALALAYNALAPSYDFFMYFFSLYMTPLMMLSGAFFPLEVMPGWMQAVMLLLPMASVVDVARDILDAQWPERLWIMVPVQLTYLCGGLYAAVRLTRRRLG